jgi:hypothetical protein
MTVHLIIVSVGNTTVDQLRSTQSRRLIAGPLCQVTPKRPDREEELLNGGSVYWIIQGQICARQRVVALEKLYDTDGEKCGLILDSELIETESVPRRPHQGWRYLEDAARPLDLSELKVDEEDDEGEDEMSPEMAAELRELGLL